MDVTATNTAFIVITVIVGVGLITWITIFFRRAARIARGGDSRLEMDLATLTPPPADAAPQTPASSTGSSIAWDRLPWAEPHSPVKPIISPAAGSIEGRLAELSDL